MGGSTRIPAVQNLAKEKSVAWDCTPLRRVRQELSSFKPMNISISPDEVNSSWPEHQSLGSLLHAVLREVVGIGAAIQAAMIAGEARF